MVIHMKTPEKNKSKEESSSGNKWEAGIPGRLVPESLDSDNWEDPRIEMAEYCRDYPEDYEV